MIAMPMSTMRSRTVASTTAYLWTQGYTQGLLSSTSSPNRILGEHHHPLTTQQYVKKRHSNTRCTTQPPNLHHIHPSQKDNPAGLQHPTTQYRLGKRHSNARRIILPNMNHIRTGQHDNHPRPRHLRTRTAKKIYSTKRSPAGVS